MTDATPPPRDDTACPDVEVLRAFGSGELPPTELTDVGRHLMSCSNCLTQLENMAPDADALPRLLRSAQSIAPLADEECRRAVALVEDLPASLAPSGEWSDSSSPQRQPILVRQLGPYDLLEPLGAGGMGAVYKGRHRHLGKLVALKLLSPNRLASASARARFRQEMKAVGGLNHPHVVQAFDAEVDDVPYLAMELVEGMDLGRVVQRLGRLKVADACEAIRQAALGLQHAHENGLVHRDIKPGNLMLTPAGVVKVLDLGLARLRAEEGAEAPLTAEGQGMGTPDYMAPEQLTDARTVDIRADLYSLGCTLFQLLAGRPPFPPPEYATFFQKQTAHLYHDPPRLDAQRPEVPAALADMVDRLLKKKPDDRFATPAEVAAALRPFAAGSNLAGILGETASAPAAADTVVPLPPTRRMRGRPRWRRAGWVAALLLAASLAAGLVWWFALRPDHPRAPARIESLEVRHYRRQSGHYVALGSLGPQTTAAKFQDDAVRVMARLSQPAYCYLLACNPDGAVQLCYPPDPRQPPAAQLEVVYPPDGVFTLTDGAGLQAFVLVASAAPLPAYEVWKSPAMPWQRSEGSGVWGYDGRRFDRLDLDRGDVRSLGEPARFAELCRWLQQRPELQALRAVAFPVGK